MALWSTRFLSEEAEDAPVPGDNGEIPMELVLVTGPNGPVRIGESVEIIIDVIDGTTDTMLECIATGVEAKINGQPQEAFTNCGDGPTRVRARFLFVATTSGTARVMIRPTFQECDPIHLLITVVLLSRPNSLNRPTVDLPPVARNATPTPTPDIAPPQYFTPAPVPSRPANPTIEPIASRPAVRTSTLDAHEGAPTERLPSTRTAEPPRGPRQTPSEMTHPLVDILTEKPAPRRGWMYALVASVALAILAFVIVASNARLFLPRASTASDTDVSVALAIPETVPLPPVPTPAPPIPDPPAAPEPAPDPPVVPLPDPDPTIAVLTDTPPAETIPVPADPPPAPITCTLPAKSTFLLAYRDKGKMTRIWAIQCQEDTIRVCPDAKIAPGGARLDLGICTPPNAKQEKAAADR